MIYADNAATTPMSEGARRAMSDAMERLWGNPSSLYSFGQLAQEALSDARARVARCLGAEAGEILFTSGGSEADNQALRSGAAIGAKQGKKHIISTAFEHHAVLHTLDALAAEGFEVTLLPVHTDGLVRPEDLLAALRPDTALVSVMFANNEIGTIQPIAELGRICRDKGVWFHTDAVQAAGAIPLNVKEMNIDMLSLSAHKFNGPKGCGALYIRRGVLPLNYLDGGGQENRKRAGTENVAGIVGLGCALEAAVADMDAKAAHLREMRDYVIDRILKTIPDTRLNGDAAQRLPGNVSISFPGLEGETILLDLDMHGVCASTGSACNSDSLDPSHVLLAIGLPHEIAHGTMRFSFGPQNTLADARTLCDILEEIIPRRRAMSPVWNALRR